VTLLWRKSQPSLSAITYPGCIAAGGFEDGAEWVEQLRTARKVFAR
jgi:hypothetical protein